MDKTMAEQDKQTKLLNGESFKSAIARAFFVVRWMHESRTEMYFDAQVYAYPTDKDTVHIVVNEGNLYLEVEIRQAIINNFADLEEWATWIDDDWKDTVIQEVARNPYPRKEN